MLEIKNAVVVIVCISLKHNGLSGQAMSSSQLSSQSILCINFHARAMLFACMLRAQS